MATPEQLRRQLDTAQDLSSVVTTMKTLAAVNIHQYEQAVEALADYSRAIEMGFHIVLQSYPLRVAAQQSGASTGAVVFGSDQGMCGQFNERIVELVRSRHRAEGDEDWTLFVVGRRAESLLLDGGFNIDATFGTPTAVSEITTLVQDALVHVERWREKSNVRRLLVLHNHRTSAASFEPNALHLLPLDFEKLRWWRDEPWPSRSLPVCASNPHSLLSQLVRMHLFTALYRACAESLASENASRIAAMQAAEKNIEEKVGELQRDYNHVRQSIITQELLDVVTGFEALTGQQ